MDLAQMAGWLAAAAAIIAMLQKSDLRLKQGLTSTPCFMGFILRCLDFRRPSCHV